MKFHTYIKEYRRRYFKDADKFCEILGVSKSMWRKVERGINPPPKKSVLRKFSFLCHMLNYEEQQMYALARRWKPSPDTNSSNHNLINKNSIKLKILGSGSIKDKINIEADLASKSAIAKLEKVGGSIQLKK